MKGGGALETLARERCWCSTRPDAHVGVPSIGEIETFGISTPEELLRLAASLDQVSPHVLAAALVRAANERGLELGFPAGVPEQHGAGIEGAVGERRVALGKSTYVRGGRRCPGVPVTCAAVRCSMARRDVRRGRRRDGGGVVVDDRIRPDAPRVIRALRRAGIERVIMVTGDHPDVAESVGAALGVDRSCPNAIPRRRSRRWRPNARSASSSWWGTG